MKRRTMAVIGGLVGSGLYGGLAVAQQNQDAAYTATLTALNNSGVLGQVVVTRIGDQLTVLHVVEGLTTGQEHPQHIHGLDDASAEAQCPTLGADADGDNIITLEESVATYGPVILPLQPFPETDNDTAVFSQTYTLGEGDTPAADALAPLTNRVVVLHGMDLAGTYVPTLPVACGQLSPITDDSEEGEAPQEAG